MRPHLGLVEGQGTAAHGLGEPERVAAVGELGPVLIARREAAALEEALQRQPLVAPQPRQMRHVQTRQVVE